jgi:hypothetical protein
MAITTINRAFDADTKEPPVPNPINPHEPSVGSVVALRISVRVDHTKSSDSPARRATAPPADRIGKRPWAALSGTGSPERSRWPAVLRFEAFRRLSPALGGSCRAAVLNLDPIAQKHTCRDPDGFRYPINLNGQGLAVDFDGRFDYSWRGHGGEKYHQAGRFLTVPRLSRAVADGCSYSADEVGRQGRQPRRRSR